MRMLPDKSTHIYCLNGTITKVQFTFNGATYFAETTSIATSLF